jgi:NADH-quinone oxidoreductase subunit J
VVFTAIIFFIAAIGAITGAFGVVLLRNPFYSVLALAVHLVSLAALFLLLRAEFVAAAQVIVYAGAVMVLYVFVVAYVGGGEQLASGGVLRVLGPLFALALAIELCIAMLGAGLKGVNSKGAAYVPGFGTPRSIGQLFLTKFLFPFEAASILLLVAAVGAVVLARRRHGLEPDEQFERQVHVPRPAWTGTMAEAGGLTMPAHAEERTLVEGEPVATPGSDRPGWYLSVSAIIFCIGAGGVLVRRNPLVVLLCLELMLNAANLALVAFARMWGNQDGQIFALIVMVVAACEVTVGLGLVVAIYRRQLPIDVDELNELQG